MPRPEEKFSVTETPAEMKRIPRNGNPSFKSKEIPRRRSDATVSGIRPSPQALSTGGLAPSATVTEKPLVRSSMEAAKPAGPPPTTNTSTFGFIPIPRSLRYATEIQIGYYTPPCATVLGDGACFATSEDAGRETADAPAAVFFRRTAEPLYTGFVV